MFVCNGRGFFGGRRDVPDDPLEEDASEWVEDCVLEAAVIVEVC